MNKLLIPNHWLALKTTFSWARRKKRPEAFLAVAPEMGPYFLLGLWDHYQDKAQTD